MATGQGGENGQKTESFASVSSAIMMKIPTNNLTSLRSCFEQSSNGSGLGLDDFLVAVISNMELLDYSEMMLMVADLIDFFHLVDINGDGSMEWEEFVMFILDCVVQEKFKKKDELLRYISTRHVQPAAIRNPIISSMTVPALGKYLMGVGLQIQIYGPDERCLPSKTSLIYTINLNGADKPLNQYLPGEKLITVLDMAFLDTNNMDILCVLRSDMSLEFIKFLSRSNYSFETIDHIGSINLDITCHRIAWRPPPSGNGSGTSSGTRGTVRLLAIGPSNEVHHWNFYPHGEHGTAQLKDYRLMKKHKDFIRDVLVINSSPSPSSSSSTSSATATATATAAGGTNNPTDSGATSVGHGSRYVITASLDKTIILWDYQTLEYLSCRTGHTAGVECLATNSSHTLLFSGGYDYVIFVWDLETTINRPLYSLHGHSSCITKIVIATDSINRACSLDEEGHFIWWDISKNIPQNSSMVNASVSTERFIETFQVPEDRARTFDLFPHPLPYTYQCLYGLILLTAGKDFSPTHSAISSLYLLLLLFLLLLLLLQPLLYSPLFPFLLVALRCASGLTR
jgi:WD40 repeat protein